MMKVNGLCVCQDQNEYYLTFSTSKGVGYGRGVVEDVKFRYI